MIWLSATTASGTPKIRHPKLSHQPPNQRIPSALRSKHSRYSAINTEDLQVEAIISRECPECHRTEMFYHTKQLRSADEGTTVFYRCECGFQRCSKQLIEGTLSGKTLRSSRRRNRGVFHLTIRLILAIIESDDDASRTTCSGSSRNRRSMSSTPVSFSKLPNASAARA